MTPKTYYQNKVADGEFFSDPAQLAVLNEMESIHQQLIEENTKRNSLIAWMRKPVSIKGLYLWGGVGIGKTFLMDCFFHSIPFQKKTA